MNRRESRQALDAACAEINANVRDLTSGAITHAEFGVRNREAHQTIERAGQSSNFARRYRSGALSRPALPSLGDRVSWRHYTGVVRSGQVVRLIPEHNSFVVAMRTGRYPEVVVHVSNLVCA